MKEKRIRVTLEEARVVSFLVDLGNLERYMSRFLALKNHQRETSEILEVRTIRDSNSVGVVMLLDVYDETDKETENKEVEKCRDYIEQFGKIERCEVETAYILSKNELYGETDYNDWYLYR